MCIRDSNNTMWNILFYERSFLMTDNKIKMPVWGPYSKKYMSISKIVNELADKGSRYDFSVHPTPVSYTHLETVVKDACAKFILDDCFWLCYLLPVKSELQDSFDKLCF